MDIHRLSILLNAQYEGKISPSEQDELNEWYHSMKVASMEMQTWINEAGGENQLSETLLSNFRKKNPPAPSRKKYWYYSAAAAIIITFSVGLLLYKINTQTSRVSPNQQITRSITPAGTDRAILTLASGEQVDLNAKSKGFISNQSGASIYKTSSGKIVYNTHSSGHVSLQDYNTLSTPRAGQYELSLPDGTHVWLNADTRLRYPAHFSGNERKVELTGEAYFEVAHNAKMPFKVQTANQEITVLGTHFNINGYLDEDNISTTLMQGSVKIKNLLSGNSSLLLPGSQSNILKGQSAISIRAVSLDQVLAWKNGYFIFENQDIKSIMKIISRWYDVDLEFKLSQNVRFGGTFSKSSDLNELLKSFELISNIKFEIKGRRVSVKN